MAALSSAAFGVRHSTISMEAAQSSRNKAYQFCARLDRIASIYKHPSVDYVLLSVEIMKLRKELATKTLFAT